MPTTARHAVRVWWDKDVQGYRIEAPYNKAFIEGLKSIIPGGSDRAYDPETKIWLIVEKWFPAIKVVADRLFPSQVSYFTREQAEKASTTPLIQRKSMDEVLLDFVKLLPGAALQKAYRAAAMDLHPDRGGSMEKMAQLNMLWARIENEKINRNGG